MCYNWHRTYCYGKWVSNMNITVAYTCTYCLCSTVKYMLETQISKST